MGLYLDVVGWAFSIFKTYENDAKETILYCKYQDHGLRSFSNHWNNIVQLLYFWVPIVTECVIMQVQYIKEA